MLLTHKDNPKLAPSSLDDLLPLTHLPTHSSPHLFGSLSRLYAALITRENVQTPNLKFTPPHDVSSFSLIYVKLWPHVFSSLQRLYICSLVSRWYGFVWLCLLKASWITSLFYFERISYVLMKKAIIIYRKLKQCYKLRTVVFKIHGINEWIHRYRNINEIRIPTAGGLQPFYLNKSRMDQCPPDRKSRRATKTLLPCKKMLYLYFCSH